MITLLIVIVLIAVLLLGLAADRGIDLFNNEKTKPFFLKTVKNLPAILCALVLAYALFGNDEKQDTNIATSQPEVQNDIYAKVRAENEDSKQKALQGDAEGQYRLGFAYIRGFGIEKDLNEGVSLLKLSAAQGNVMAQLELGDFYANREDAPPNIDEAIHWYKLAANNKDGGIDAFDADWGVNGARLKLGEIYCKGKGVPVNVGEGVSWYKMAAEDGNKVAMFQLGLIYANGWGVANDNVIAYMWYYIATKQKSKDFMGLENFKDKVALLMTQQEVATARNFAEQCIASNYKNCLPNI